MSKHKAYHIIVSGNVQGVSFRAFLLGKAETYGVQGWVRNLPTGQVEILCQGKHPQIEAFMEFCGTGPEFAEIDEIDCKEEEIDEDFDGFEVREDEQA